jgi:hypothetical protein
MNQRRKWLLAKGPSATRATRKLDVLRADEVIQ